VLFELRLIAEDLGNKERAIENLESMFDATSRDPSVYERFYGALIASGNAGPVLLALERRFALENNRANCITTHIGEFGESCGAAVI